MNKIFPAFLTVNAVLFIALTVACLHKKESLVSEKPVIQLPRFTELAPLPVEPPIQTHISNPTPSYMNYEKTVAQLKQWNSEAPELTEVGTYGKTSHRKDCYYIRICKKQSFRKPCLLVTACIHGNEPLSSSITMWYIGTLLNQYGKDQTITKLINERDMYFVPVLSPDSYPNSRHVDGQDPNRDFPTPSKPNHKSVAPVVAIQDLFNKIKPNAVISGHTWGRAYLMPYGDTDQNCPDYDQMRNVLTKCQTLSDYRLMRACDMYKRNGGLNNPPIRLFLCFGEGVPIHGSEVDWYYRHGSFAIVCEYGTHQRIPSNADTKNEFDRTFKAFLLFAKEAPLVKLTNKGA